MHPLNIFFGLAALSATVCLPSVHGYATPIPLPSSTQPFGIITVTTGTASNSQQFVSTGALINGTVNFSQSGNGGSANLSASISGDPFIQFAVGATDIGAPTTFTFLFFVPLSPFIGQLSAVEGLLSATGTNFVVPLHPSQTHVASIALDPTLGGTLAVNNVGLCAAGVDVGSTATSTDSPPPSFPLTVPSGKNTGSWNFDTGLRVYAPSPLCNDALITELSFTGSGGGTSYSFSGSFTLSQLPEPMTIALLGGAVIGLAAARGRERTG